MTFLFDFLRLTDMTWVMFISIELTGSIFVLLKEESIDSGFARFDTIIPSLKALDEGFSSKNYVRKFLRDVRPKWRTKVTTIEESEDLSSLALDELISNLKNFKKFFRRKGKFVRQPRKEKKSFRQRDEKKVKSDRKVLDAVIQIISLAIVQNHLATKIKRPSLGFLER
nr:UBN2 domain-containing protein [Tanacetum cinerariifolium]